jgi:hypothetical protein
MSKIKEASLEREEDETRDVTVAAETLPAASSEGWNEIPESGGSLIVGYKIKFDFNNRCWVVNEVKVEPDTMDEAFVVVGVKAAWLRWGEDKKRPEQRVTEPGQRHPLREELPEFDDEDAWPLGLDGKTPADPWKDTRYIYLISKETAIEHTFVTDTYGGRRAVSDLKQQIANARRVHPDAVPIVKLSIATMPTNYGPKPRPVLKVVGWHGVGPELVPAADEPKVQRYSPDRITSGPQRMKSGAVVDDNEPPAHTDLPPERDPDDEIPF